MLVSGAEVAAEVADRLGGTCRIFDKTDAKLFAVVIGGAIFVSLCAVVRERSGRGSRNMQEADVLANPSRIIEFEAYHFWLEVER